MSSYLSEQRPVYARKMTEEEMCKELHQKCGAEEKAAKALLQLYLDYINEHVVFFDAEDILDVYSVVTGAELHSVLDEETIEELNSRKKDDDYVAILTETIQNAEGFIEWVDVPSANNPHYCFIAVINE